MRDIFDDIFRDRPLDPMEAARRYARPTLRKRFYATVSIAADHAAHAISLAGKPVRTPAGRTLAAPNVALAECIADEWRAQTNVIDPAAMPLTRLANTIIDSVA